MDRNVNQSQKGITVKKAENFSEWYSQVIEKAELAEYGPIHGTIAFTPNSYAIWENIRAAFDQMIRETGHKNAYFPLMIPESLLKKESEHLKAFVPEVFWVTHEGEKELSDRYAIRPTSETIIYYFFSKWLRSWRDLPLLVNQWCNVLRAEIKDTKPFIRTSEFLWQEGHTAHETNEEAAKEVAMILEFYKKIAEEYLAVPVIPGRKSNMEKFGGADYTTTIEAIMPDGKALQMGTSHNLGQNFAKAFGLKFLGKDEKEHLAWTTSWGISSRMLGALIMVHGDDNGLIMPPKVAHTQIVIVPIFKDESKNQVLKYANKIFNEIKREFKAEIDLRDGFTPGYKFNDWEIKGVPLRIEVGPKEMQEGSAVFARRDTKEKKTVKVSDVKNEARLLLDNIQKAMFIEAKNKLKESITEAKDYSEFKKIIASKGGFVKASWCGRDECELRIKEDTTATNRVIPFNEGRRGRCIVCGGETDIVAYFAKAY
ncbi:MAG: proline--tRNA ligase [Candidatus Micrarchaeaceae archaeon]